MTDDNNSKRSSADVTFENPGDLMVEIIRHLFSRAATVASVTLLQSIFANKEYTIEQFLWEIDRRGMVVKIHAELEAPAGATDPSTGLLDPAIQIAAVDETVTLAGGMLKTAVTEQVETPDCPVGPGGGKIVH